MNNKTKTIYAEDVEFNYEGGTGGDAGLGFNAKCPDCRDSINVAEGQWWDSICSCGYKWCLSSIKVEAEKEIEIKPTVILCKSGEIETARKIIDGTS